MNNQTNLIQIILCFLTVFGATASVIAKSTENAVVYSITAILSLSGLMLSLFCPYPAVELIILFAAGSIPIFKILKHCEPIKKNSRLDTVVVIIGTALIAISLTGPLGGIFVTGGLPLLHPVSKDFQTSLADLFVFYPQIPVLTAFYAFLTVSGYYFTRARRKND